MGPYYRTDTLIIMMIKSHWALQPQLDAIKDKYYEMFRNKTGKGPAGTDML